MFLKIKNTFFLVSFFIFVFFTTKHYLSDENIIFTNKSRSSYFYLTNKNLPVLKNDTNNIIIYKKDLDEFKEKRKERFWEKLISNSNE